METIEQQKNVKNLDVTFLRPHFRTSTTGKVQAIIKMEPVNPENKRILGNNDALLFDSTNEFFSKGIGPFSEFRVEYNLDSGLIEIETMNRKGQNTEKPTHCNSCNRPLDLHNQDKEIYCKNPLCPAQSLTCIRQIVYNRLAPDAKKKLNSFLRNYLVSGDKFPIDNLYEFREAFFKMNCFPKKTVNRQQQWLDKYGANGYTYHEIEMTYEAVLNRKEIPRQEFWEVCSFPYENRNFVSQVPQDFKLANGRYLDPKKVLVEDIEHADHILNKMSNWSQKLLSSNRDFIKLLFHVYTNGGEVKWI